MKPPQFRTACVLTQSTPYEALDLAAKEAYAATGNLDTGRVVWISEAPMSEAQDERTTAYAEGIGLISVATSILRNL